jgi:hypothetical protein
VKLNATLWIVFFSVLAPALGQAPAGDAWVPLFNGRDLSGWRAHGKEKWLAQNGAILGEAVTDKYGYLVTEKTYGDFVLRVRFKCDAPGNYGVFLRSRMIGEGEYGPDIEGTQVEIDPSRDTGGIYESGGRQWIARSTKESARAIKPFEWNDLEIAIEGRHIVTRLNGVQIVDYSDPAPRFFDGVIGLQLHSGGGGKIHIKDIQMLDLSGKSGK